MSDRKLTPELIEKLKGYGLATGTIEYMIKIEDGIEVVEVEDGTEDVIDANGATVLDSKGKPKTQKKLKSEVRTKYLPEEYCPVFTLKLPTNADFKKIRIALAAKKVSDVTEGGNETVEEVISKAVVGWHNYFDLTTGDEIEFNSKLIKDLSPKIQANIFVHISKMTGLI